MLVLLFFIALNVWCAENASEDADYRVISHYWERYARWHPTTENLNCVCQSGLESAKIVRTPGVEQLYFSSGHKQLFIQMPEIILDPGGDNSIMRIGATCSCPDGSARIGHVFGAPVSADLGCLAITQSEEPSKAVFGQFSLDDTQIQLEEPSKAVFGQFSLNGARKPRRFCGYHAKKTGFKVIRFLKEYTNQTCFFVSAKFYYNNLHCVVVKWGYEYPDWGNGGSCNFNFQSTCSSTPAQRALPLCCTIL